MEQRLRQEMKEYEILKQREFDSRYHHLQEQVNQLMSLLQAQQLHEKSKSGSSEHLDSRSLPRLNQRSTSRQSYPEKEPIRNDGRPNHALSTNHTSQRHRAAPQTVDGAPLRIRSCSTGSKTSLKRGTRKIKSSDKLRKNNSALGLRSRERFSIDPMFI